MTLEAEGGYANVVTDPGGETYMGISRKWHPGWPGWPVIDAIKHPIKHNSKGLVPNELVFDFYHKEFWVPLKLDLFDNQRLCNQVFDHAVTSGIKSAIKRIQMAAGINPDGIMGPITASEIMFDLNRDAAALNRRILIERVAFYMDLAEADAVHEFNFPSWIARTSKCYAGV